MSINTRYSYITLGTALNSDNTLANPLVLPAPMQVPASDEFLAEAERNADGTMIIQQIGRTQYTMQIKWTRLKAEKWWEINRWFADYGYVFYMEYFSHTDGKVKIHRFYRGNSDKGNPSYTTQVKDGITVPTHYHDCGFSIIDMGEDDVLVTKELAVSS